MAIREGLLAEFDHEMAATRRLLACVPGDRLTWRPHPRSRSFGELGAHMASITSWSAHILERERFDLDEAVLSEEGAATASGLVDAFAEQVARARTRLDRSDAELAAPWSLLQGDRCCSRCRVPRRFARSCWATSFTIEASSPSTYGSTTSRCRRSTDRRQTRGEVRTQNSEVRTGQTRSSEF